MPRRCSVCSHPERQAIEQALLDNESLRDIAGRYRVAKSSVDRHKAEHLPQALLRSRQAQEVADADNLLDRLSELTSDAQRIRGKAEKTGDLRTALAGVRELVRIIELQAKLVGELQQEGTTNILIAPEWLSVRGVLMETLRAYPEARQAVAANLARLEAPSEDR